MLKNITSDVAFTWLTMQRGGQVGSGMNEQKGRGATQAEKQTQAAVQGMLLWGTQALAEAHQCAALVHSVSQPCWTVSTPTIFLRATKSVITFLKAGCTVCQLGITHWFAPWIFLPTAHLWGKSKAFFSPAVNEQILGLWIAACKQWDSSRILLWYVCELRYVHNYVTLRIYLSESICTNTVIQCHRPKGTLWLMWISQVKPRSPSPLAHAGWHPYPYQHQPELELKREGRSSALHNCHGRAGPWGALVSNKQQLLRAGTASCSRTSRGIHNSNKVLFSPFSILSQKPTVPLKCQSKRVTQGELLSSAHTM